MFHGSSGTGPPAGAVSRMGIENPGNLGNPNKTLGSGAPLAFKSRHNLAQTMWAHIPEERHMQGLKRKPGVVTQKGLRPAYTTIRSKLLLPIHPEGLALIAGK